jgi:hypothetical protein
MTMPHERTRSLRWGWEFLNELSYADNMTVEQAEQIRKILLHYPTTKELWDCAALTEKIHSSNVTCGLLPENIYSPGSPINVQEPTHVDRGLVSKEDREKALKAAVDFFHVTLRFCENLTESQRNTLTYVRRHFPMTVWEARGVFDVDDLAD